MVAQHRTDQFLGQLGKMRREFSEGVVRGCEEGEVMTRIVEEVDEGFVFVDYFGKISCIFA